MMPPQKRNLHSAALCEATALTVNNTEKSNKRTRTREPLASKLRKQMLNESSTSLDCKDQKRTVTGITISASLCPKVTVNGSFANGMLYDFSAQYSTPPQCPSQIMCRLQRSLNFVHYLYGASLGTASTVNKQSVLSPLARELDDLSLFRTATPFDRRVTALDWHPTNPEVVVAGSKGGDIILWNTLHLSLDQFIQGMGPGGSIQAVKFWPWNRNLVLTASIDGRVMLNDFEGKRSQVLSDTFNCYEGPGGNISGIKFHPFNRQCVFTSSLDGHLTLHDLTGRCSWNFLNTFTWDFWYCCVDVTASRKAVVTGDNIGNTLMLSLEGKKLWTHRLHKQKVTHAEFSPREDWLFCTASTDQTVKIWDIRKVTGRDSALFVLKHDKPINSAYFSRTDGCRLLTTDQHSQVRIYRAPEWQQEQTIDHPHRFFQHITPIKASWHPLQDLVVVGRYPSKEFPGYEEGELRTIDILDADSGKMVSQLHDPSAPGIVSLNKFNARGDFLVSGMGLHLLLWGRSQEVEERQRSLMSNCINSRFDPMVPSGRGSGSRSSNPRSRPPASKQSKAKKDCGMKMKLQTKVGTKMKSPK